MVHKILTAFGAALLLSACAGSPPEHHLPGPRARAAFHPPSEAILKYDTNKDGIVTKAEFNAGIRAEFAAADTNHDGILDMAEMRAVNAARWDSSASTMSPLIDWNQDGHIDFEEFSAAPKSLFAQMDKDEDGNITQEEIHPVRRHYNPPVRQVPYGNSG